MSDEHRAAGRELIDPEELPFTRDEVYRALRLWYPEERARLEADHVAECGPGYVEARAERRAEWRAAGVPDADSIPLSGWALTPELLPALSALSADAAARVDSLMRREWEVRRKHYVGQAMLEAAQRAGLIPALKSTPGDPGCRGGGQWRVPPLPEPTPEMLAAAEARVAEKRAAWEALAAESRRRLRGGDRDRAV